MIPPDSMLHHFGSAKSLMEFHYPYTIDKPTSTHQTEDDVEAFEGENITISCEVEGYPRASIMWYAPNDTMLENNDRVLIIETHVASNEFHPATRSELLIRDALIGQHNGTYRCEAVNEIGVQSIAVRLTGKK